MHNLTATVALTIKISFVRIGFLGGALMVQVDFGSDLMSSSHCMLGVIITNVHECESCCIYI